MPAVQAPKKPGERRRRNVPERGEWKEPPKQSGWRFGEVPDIDFPVSDSTRKTWETWFGSWFAAFWTPDDLPGLRVTIALYEEREKYRKDPVLESVKANGDVILTNRRDPSSELRAWMAEYGISPKGQQDRRWARPEPEKAPATAGKTSGPYGHLSIVGK